MKSIYSKNLMFLLVLASTLISCQGRLNFRMIDCAEGQIKVGNRCETPETTRAGCKDFDLSKVLKGETVVRCDGSIAEGTFVPASDCKTDGEQNCVNKSTFKALDVSKFTSDKITYGEKVFGVTGSTRKVKVCRNYASLSSYDATYPPTNFGGGLSGQYAFMPADVTLASDQISVTWNHGLINNSPLKFTTTGTLPSPLVPETTYYAIYVSATVFRVASIPNGTQIDLTAQGSGIHYVKDVADGVIKYYDTIDDWNALATDYPRDNPWDGDYFCDSTNFVEVTSTKAPLLPSGTIPSTANVAFTKIWQDKLTGLYLTNSLYDGVPNNRFWSDAIKTCESINGGTAGDGWRLPTQKELLQVYVNGASRLLGAGSLGGGHWTATAQGDVGSIPWVVNLLNGNATYTFPFSNNHVLCVR